MAAFPIVLFIVGAVVIGFLAYFAHLHEKARTQALKAWAAANQWTFSEDKFTGTDEHYPEIEALQRGFDRYAYNLGRGRVDGRAAMFFDYHYATRSTDSKGKSETHHHRSTVVLIESGLRLQKLEIRAENIFDKFVEFVGLNDIDFESDEFSRKFHVKAADRRFAYDIIDQNMMDYLLAAPSLPISMARGRIWVTNDQTWDVDKLQKAFALASGLLERIAPSVVRELQPAGAGSSEQAT